MRLATLKDGSRDGVLLVVDEGNIRAVAVRQIAQTLQQALDDWFALAPLLDDISDALNRGKLDNTLDFKSLDLMAPLPRAYQWCEASIYMSHLERCRRATNRSIPAELYEEIGVAQMGSDCFIGPRDAIIVEDESHLIDYEAAIAVITDDIPMGASGPEALSLVRLVVLTNDVSLRGLQWPEMAKGLGVYQSKPANSFAPVAVTPDSLGPLWSGGLLSAAVFSEVNGTQMGSPRADRDANFNFADLLSFIARTRNIGAGSVVSLGTISNRDESLGTACLLERRAIEQLQGKMELTPFLKFGDRLRIHARDDAGRDLFGSIDQIVAPVVRRAR